MLELARDSLEIKRKTIQKHIDQGLFPYTKRYLGTLRNHFSTIGVNGLNEMIRNFTDDAMVIRTMTNTKFKIDDHSEVVNMCEAIQGLIDDGVKSEKRETALRLMKMGFSIKQIAQATELSEDDVLKLIQK